MNFSINKSDHYTLVKTDLTEIDGTQAENLVTELEAHIDEFICKYIILNFDNVTHCNADAVRALIKLGLFLKERDGMLIISNPLDSFERLFEKAEIVFVPTDIEAIDYVFMDQIEKQFLNDSEEDA
ncbi:MAG: STAS domain-containing protein [Bacteroidia bacterium]